MCLPDSQEDLGLNLLGDLVSHDGLELWLLQADVRKKETLVVWVQLPHNCVLGTQREQVPLPNRAGRKAPYVVSAMELLILWQWGANLSVLAMRTTWLCLWALIELISCHLKALNGWAAWDLSRVHWFGRMPESRIGC